jgi:site-specific recombinase XerD
MATLNSLFEQFLRERRYLKNVSPKTITWYETSWKSFCATQPPGLAMTVIASQDIVTRQHLSAFVVALRDRGVRPVTVNTWLRAINAYCRWLQEEGVIRERVTLRPLKLEKRFVKTHDEKVLRAIIGLVTAPPSGGPTR